MSTSVNPEDIVVFYWGMSAWARKVNHYLALRGMPHAECDQPITLPRPDMKALGINYRRIPVVAIGRDIYCDTLLILEKLEELFPATGQYKGISSKKGTEVAVEKLLEKWTDVVVFKPAAEAIPTSLELLKDPNFVKDRTELWGRDWSAEKQDALRPAALSNLMANFAFLENVLSDGREWLLGNTDGPQLADIHAAWIFTWLDMLGAFPDSHFSADHFPKTRAWMKRYDDAIAAALDATKASTKKLESEKALTKVLSGDFVDAQLRVMDDPQGFRAGIEVEVFPIDTGFNHRDVGRLVGLSTREVVIEKRAPSGEGVRVHYPRWNFTINVTGRGDGGGGNSSETVGKAAEKKKKHDDGLGDDPLGLRPQMSRMKSSNEFGHHDI